MKTTIYIDVLVAVNFIVNYFLLKITALISCVPQNRKRMLASAAFGALFSVVILFDLPFFISLIIKFMLLLMCTFIAFGYKNSRIFLRSFMCLCASNAILAGALEIFLGKSKIFYTQNLTIYFNINPVLLIVCIISVYLIISIFEFIFKDKFSKMKYDFTLCDGGKTLTLAAFYDTGFKLKDILNGKSIMLCSFDEICGILSSEKISDIKAFNADFDVKNIGITPVFYSDISKNGVLPAIKIDRITYKEKEIKDVIIAVTNRPLSEDAKLIFGKEIFDVIGD